MSAGSSLSETGTGFAGNLLERERELAALDALASAAVGRDGAGAIVTGPAGIGKTRLLRAAGELASRAGVRTLAARASELERDFPFGVVRQLLEAPVLAAAAQERAALLGGAARHAAPILDLEEPVAGAGDRHAAVHALYWLVANLAETSPLLLTVDDAQWADEGSLRFLAYLVRRLQGLPVAVLATVREGEAAEHSAVLGAVLAEPAVERLRPEPLSADAVGRLMEFALGGPVDRTFAQASWSRTGGNPFLVAELTAQLAERGVRPTAERVQTVQHMVPERVGEAVARRLARLAQDARALARMLAILGDEAELPVAARLADLSPDEAAQAAAALARADLVDGEPEGLRFRHPLIHGAVSAGIPAADRVRAHGRAARLLAGRSAAEGRIVGHLLATPGGDGDEWVVDRLSAAARSARSKGAPEQAAVQLRRALAEPPARGARASLLRELGSAELAAMEPDAAEHLRAAAEEVTDRGERADLALELAVALYFAGRHPEAVDILLAALSELGEAPEYREHALRLEAFLGTAGRYDLRTETPLRQRLQRLAAGLRGDTPGERMVRAVAALEAPGPSAYALARAAELAESVRGELPWPDPSEGVGNVAMYLHAGRPDAARALADRLGFDARASGSPVRHALALGASGAVHADLGMLDDAEADLRASLAALPLDLAPLPPTVGLLLPVLAETGRLGEAQALLEEHELEGELPEQMLLNPLLFGRGVLRAAQRRWDEAAEDLLELGRRHERWEMRRPSPPWRSSAALALLAEGDRTRARALATAELELARTWDTPKAIGTALRAYALVERGKAGLAGLREAVRVLEDGPWRLEAARARCDLGAALRRLGRRREARAELAAAMDVTHTCGAHRLAEIAAEELRATGARPRKRALTGVEALTPSEARVAALAARGHSNQEIAQQLFVTLATVETHLTRTYRKLDVAGREGLAGALSA